MQQQYQAQDSDALSSAEQLDYEIEQYNQHEQQQSSGVSRVLIYVGALVVLNIILIAVDAPFYIY